MPVMNCLQWTRWVTALGRARCFMMTMESGLAFLKGILYHTGEMVALTSYSGVIDYACSATLTMYVHTTRAQYPKS